MYLLLVVINCIIRQCPPNAVVVASFLYAVSGVRSIIVHIVNLKFGIQVYNLTLLGWGVSVWALLLVTAEDRRAASCLPW